LRKRLIFSFDLKYSLNLQIAEIKGPCSFFHKKLSYSITSKSLFFGKKIFKHKDHPPVGGDSPFGKHQETTKDTKKD